MEDRNSEATVYMGNLDERVNDSLVWELMIQAGPVTGVHLPKDRVSTSHQGFGFAEFHSVEDAEYAVKIMNGIRLFGKPIRVNKASADKKHQVEVGAQVFVGNLDPTVDERLLQDTFGAFGTMSKAPQVVRDEEGRSKGYGFVSFDSFDVSDTAIEAMNNQYLANQTISVSYAFKQGSKGDRHGDQAERLLAVQAKKNNYSLAELKGPSEAPGTQSPAMPMKAPGPLPAGFQNQATPMYQPPPGFAPPHV